jgi:hypothetical protein
MKNTMNETRITLEVFCKRHRDLAEAAKSLVKTRCVEVDAEGKVSESLLRVAAGVRAGKIQLGRKERAISDR